MMYKEFLNLTKRKVSFEKYTKEIESKYMKSELNKQEFCKQYIEQTKRPRRKTNEIAKFNKDKFIKAVKFSTAVKALSKMIQNNDGDVFFISDIIYNYEQGLKKWNDIVEKNEQKAFNKLPIYRLEELVTVECGDKKSNNYCKTIITSGKYYDYWRSGELYFRMTIELYEDGRAYIDCGYKNQF